MRRRRRVRLTRPVTSPRDRTGGIREDRAEPRSGARLHFCARTRGRHMGAHIAVGADLPMSHGWSSSVWSSVWVGAVVAGLSAASAVVILARALHVTLNGSQPAIRDRGGE